MCIFLLEQRVPLHPTFYPNPLRTPPPPFFCPCQSGGILFKGIECEYYRPTTVLLSFQNETIQNLYCFFFLIIKE